MNSNRAAVTAIAAADARAARAAFGSNLAAMNSNRAAVTAIAAADAGVIGSSLSLQRAHSVSFRLGIDGEAVSCGDIDAFRGGQLAPVLQNQVDIAGDGDAGVYLYSTSYHIPITFVSTPRGQFVGFIYLGVICDGTGICHFTTVPFLIFHRFLRRLPPRRKGQEQQQGK